MNQAADRHPRRVGRVLPGDLPVPLRAAGRRLKIAAKASLRPPGIRPIGEHRWGGSQSYDRPIM